MQNFAKAIGKCISLQISRKVGIPFKDADDFVSRIEHPETKARLMATGEEAVATGVSEVLWVTVSIVFSQMDVFQFMFLAAKVIECWKCLV